MTRLWILVMLLGLLSGCRPTWDCHGAGFMQGCKDGRIQHRYYQTCDATPLFQKPLRGYRWVDEEAVVLGEPIYNQLFDANDTCEWRHGITENTEQMMSLMGFPRP